MNQNEENSPDATAGQGGIPRGESAEHGGELGGGTGHNEGSSVGQDQRQEMLKILRSTPKEVIAQWVADDNLMGLFTKIQEDALKKTKEQEQRRAQEELIRRKEELRQAAPKNVKWAQGKDYKKLLQCVCGPYNSKQEARFFELLKTNVCSLEERFTEQGRMSDYFREALEYNLSKQRVEPDWIKLLMKQGFAMSASTVPALFKWIETSSNFNGGGIRWEQWMEMFERVDNWKVLEKECETVCPDLQFNAFDLLEFHFRTALNATNQGYSVSLSKMQEAAAGLKLLKKAWDDGCRPSPYSEKGWLKREPRNQELSNLGRKELTAEQKTITHGWMTRLFNYGLTCWSEAMEGRGDAKEKQQMKDLIKEYQEFVTAWLKGCYAEYAEELKQKHYITLSNSETGMYLEPGKKMGYGDREAGEVLPSWHWLTEMTQWQGNAWKEEEVFKRLTFQCEREKEWLKEKPEDRYSPWGYSRFGWMAHYLGRADLSKHNEVAQQAYLRWMEYFLEMGDQCSDITPKKNERRFNNKLFVDLFGVLQEKEGMLKALNEAVGEKKEQEVKAPARRL